MASEKPQRRYVVKIEIGGDDWTAVDGEIERVLEHVREHGDKCSLVSGGCSTGAIVTVLHNPDMTHERYFAELDKHLEEAKRGK